MYDPSLVSTIPDYCANFQYLDGVLHVSIPMIENWDRCWSAYLTVMISPVLLWLNRS